MADRSPKLKGPEDFRKVARDLTKYATKLNQMADEIEDFGVDEVKLNMGTLIHLVEGPLDERMVKLRAALTVALKHVKKGMKAAKRSSE